MSSRLGPQVPTTLALRPPLSVDQLLWVANTRHGPGGHWFARVRKDSGDHDHLRQVDDAVRYLGDHHVPVPPEPPAPAHLALLAVLRESVRALLEPTSSSIPPGIAALLDASAYRVGRDGRISAAAQGWDALIADLGLAYLQLVDLRPRLRICGNPHCRLIFLDLSRNRTRRWCDGGGCGNRARVGRHRAEVAERAS